MEKKRFGGVGAAALAARGDFGAMNGSLSASEKAIDGTGYGDAASRSQWMCFGASHHEDDWRLAMLPA